MKLKFSTTFLLTALCLSGSQLYAAEAGNPYKLNAILKGQSQLSEQLNLLANCVTTLQTQIETTAETQGGGLSSSLTDYDTGPTFDYVPSGCALVMKTVTVTADGLLTITTPTAPSAGGAANAGTSTALYDQTFVFTPYVDAAETAYSSANSQPVGIQSWTCSYAGGGTAVNLKSLNILGVSTNVLAASPLPLSYC
ncbi:MAG: hypothetical protein LRY67_02555 [Gammaproteobacteria bacterium]|nr:hypothetical protein [Gammaproteobacteria bacterium]MCD8542572.1 hypothetical protein [Gammaproteobacteria bacterium]